MADRAAGDGRGILMHVRWAGIGAVLLLGLADSASAQQGPDRAQAASIQVDVSRLPLNLERIQRELRQSTLTEERDSLKLRYQIEVFGRAPEIRFFTPEDNLTTGPVPYGAPTHQEMIQHVTPQEYRSPVMDFSSLFRWLAQKAKQ
ncbi:MAG TPA: hypothetical protein VIX63_03970 [Vicinamibacterales bacterium]